MHVYCMDNHTLKTHMYYTCTVLHTWWDTQQSEAQVAEEKERRRQDIGQPSVSEQHTEKHSKEFPGSGDGTQCWGNSRLFRGTLAETLLRSGPSHREAPLYVSITPSLSLHLPFYSRLSWYLKSSPRQTFFVSLHRAGTRRL